MPLNQRDAFDVLQAMRRRLRDSPFDFAEEDATRAAFSRDDGAAGVVRYLDVISQAVAAAAGRPLQTTIESLNRAVRTPTGASITDVVVAPSALSEAFRDPDGTVLQADPDLLRLADELASLRDLVARDNGLTPGGAFQ